MAGYSDTYIPVDVQPLVQRQAVRVWAIVIAVTLLWLMLILSAPVAAIGGFEAVAEPVYGFFGYICHQRSERSFHLAGNAFGVCSRCFGVYFGLFAGALAYPIFRRIDDIEPVARFWLFLAMVPIGLDWSLTVFGIWENTQISRSLTGLILGAACAVFIIPAAVEIMRNLTFGRVGAKKAA